MTDRPPAVTVPHYRDMKNPLRRVERQVMHDVLGNGTPIIQDLLECGHLLPPSEDIYGVRWPARRRCCKCRLEMPADLDLQAAAFDGPALASVAASAPTQQPTGEDRKERPNGR